MATTHWDILKPPILKHAGTKPRNLHSGVLECQGIVSEVLPVHTKSNCVDKDLLFLSTIYNPFWLWSGASRTYISRVIYYIYIYIFITIYTIYVSICVSWMMHGLSSSLLGSWEVCTSAWNPVFSHDHGKMAPGLVFKTLGAESKAAGLQSRNILVLVTCCNML